ncbi:alanine racemase [Croceicoccus sp. F390]|uniref:alanine racemase n=1 Tax=Croceicoccus esteveae TaxID=3075597 RepID=A0ABU2ZG22_9SPHN|nr:alanine racemase [Croceicoccus sp. F390]MDT0575533.1 alanine racemase [Croceicoccus sp. F390]
MRGQGAEPEVVDSDVSTGGAVLPPQAARLSFDAAALADNWRALDRMSGKAQAGAAVKANAYGTGVDRVVPTLAKAGCRQFYVAHWREGPAVMAHVPASMISVLHGPANDAETAFALATGLRPVLNSGQQVERWRAAGGGVCDLMVDTGMNRLGLADRDWGDALNTLEIDTLLSHLACADEDNAMNMRQQALFSQAITAIRHRRASLANSAGIALGSCYHHDLTRPGLALYGGVPRSELDGVIRDVVAPQAMILQTRQVPAGATIGYNATFTAPADMRIGIVSIGYADGYLRNWSGRGVFCHEGAVLPVIGRVSMDMVALDLAQAMQLGEGDWVTASYRLPDAARCSGLSQYELLTLLGQRLHC